MTTRQRIDQNATANGWTRDVADASTIYTRGGWRLGVDFTPTGRISGWALFEIHPDGRAVRCKFSAKGVGGDKRAAVLAELAR